MFSIFLTLLTTFFFIYFKFFNFKKSFYYYYFKVKKLQVYFDYGIKKYFFFHSLQGYSQPPFSFSFSFGLHLFWPFFYSTNLFIFSLNSRDKSLVIVAPCNFFSFFCYFIFFAPKYNLYNFFNRFIFFY